MTQREKNVRLKKLYEQVKEHRGDETATEVPETKYVAISVTKASWMMIKAHYGNVKEYCERALFHQLVRDRLLKPSGVVDECIKSPASGVPLRDLNVAGRVRGMSDKMFYDEGDEQ